MGNKDSRPNRKVNSELKKEKQQAQKIKKILLLGANNSGKTTIFKQIQQIYGDGFDEKGCATGYIQSAMIYRL